MKKNKKGFTLAELLVVVAIIAVLVVIAIPVFKGATDKAKEAAVKANMRAAYAELAMCELDAITPDKFTVAGKTIDGQKYDYSTSGGILVSAGGFTYNGTDFEKK